MVDGVSLSLPPVAPSRNAVVTAPPDEEGARASAWGILARLMLGPPDAALLAALADDVGPGAGLIPSELESAWQALADAASVVPADLVADEYAALFEAVGAPLVDPCASRYLAGFLMEKPLAALRGDLAALGLGRARGARVTEDHLGALAETLRLLVAGAPPLVEPWPLAVQRDFFARHVEPWVGRCLDDIQKAEPARFYRCVARWACALVEVEGEAFALLDGEPQEDAKS